MRRVTGPQLEAVRSVLNRWDPIGIITSSGPHDEYDNYLAPVASLLIERRGLEEIAAFLHQLETECMGLNGDYSQCLHYAKELVALDVSLEEF